MSAALPAVCLQQDGVSEFIVLEGCEVILYETVSWLCSADKASARFGSAASGGAFQLICKQLALLARAAAASHMHIALSEVLGS